MHATRCRLVVLVLTIALISDIGLQSRHRYLCDAVNADNTAEVAQWCDRIGKHGSFEWLGASASPLRNVEEVTIMSSIGETGDTGHFSAWNFSEHDDTGRQPLNSRWSESSVGREGTREYDIFTLEIPHRTEVPMGWVDPRLRGGRMLDFTLPGRGEPLNVIISGLSDPYILTPRGLLHYAQTLGFSTECLGLHIGMLHVANLGDSMLHDPFDDSSPPFHASQSRFPDSDDPESDPYPTTGGNKTEKLLVRQNFDWPLYGWPDYGTCWESLVGGNHFRAWKQDGAGARTGAWFLAVSQELWVGAHHDISINGYNGGRDHLVSRAIKPTRWSPTLDGIWWTTEVTYNTSLLEPGRQGINHGISQDGRVAILTVRRRDGPPSAAELESAWQGLLNSSTKWGSYDYVDQRRAQWELQPFFVQSGNLPIHSGSVEFSDRGWWHWATRLFYRIWTLP
ncbi:hypothetical protein FRC18_002498 [Serendipita sp. 400]|nr:hypothetical protein FRC18_002498 [Serendipita sp. 400]